ncbi:LL-diaminopimelate aminotransferase [Treponema parvum]|uniref:LL-diaminopimelate aminotransferase n=1 Tax=Treponema parvum TaxID=138851 RepID=A0A975F4P6_9SPIR|nr:LL-diaminopimelate aminotransferase [Treponema parvum]QTQ14411.1 LL-diaminopimelate aminotransferase [Treponema parvum]
MINRNKGFANLTAGYLFPEVARRRREFAARHPDASIISLGIGNTTEPLTPHIAKAMSDYALALSTPEGYSGYGDEQGMAALREKLAQVFYPNMISPDEVFVSDGAKCDIARVQVLFGKDVKIAVQDPAYPVYVDGSVVIGAAGKMKQDGTGYEGIVYMPCVPENNFFPDLSVVPPDSVIYFCSPNNPTGAASSKKELEHLVDYALKRGCVIIYDAAYSAFIRDPSLPKTIYEISGAENCAIEINSFSKPAGFTGVRLGWSVVPKKLKFADGSLVHSDWNRVMTTLFNGASNIAQAGALAALDETGLSEMKSLIDYYLENVKTMTAALSAENFKKSGVKVYSTGNSPYLWVFFPGYKSWEIFDKILAECNVVVTPGSGFGPAGEGFVRFSAFGHHKDVNEACKRFSRLHF